MNYIAQDEELEKPINELVEAIEGFSIVADNRIKSKAWSKEHKMKLVKFQKVFVELRCELVDLVI
jgi:hypothetical protein